MFVSRILLIAAAAVCLTSLAAQKSLADGPAVSPFRGLRLVENGIEAQVHDDTWYPLLAVDGVATKTLLADSKRICGSKWWKRITEDLPALMDAMGHPMEATANLKVRDPKTGKERTFEGVRMTGENRRRLKGQYRGGAPEAGAPTRAFGDAEAHADLAELRALLDGAFAYRHRRDVDVDAWVRDALWRIKGRVTRAALAKEIQGLMQEFGDGHSGVASREARYHGAWLPFLVQRVDGGYAAFHDRREPLNRDYPFVVAIQGVPIERWVEASAKRALRGSPAMMQRETERGLRAMDELRKELGLRMDEKIEVTLAARDGTTTRYRTEVEDRKPIYGPWPRSAPESLGADGMLPGKVGYIRIGSMRDSAELLDGLDEAMAGFRETNGLIVDVRGNGGGTRHALRRLFPYFLGKDEGPQVVNVARRIVSKRERDRMDLLTDRFMMCVDDPKLSIPQKDAVDAFMAGFEPEWTPPGDHFSRPHVLLIQRSTNTKAYPYGKPVRILMDGGCFSATDIFLAAMKTRPQVQLVGTPSGGGSGRARRHRLTNSGIELRLSSMVSYQPTGHLFEGRGVQPDIVAVPQPEDLVRGDADSVLDAALKSMR